MIKEKINLHYYNIQISIIIFEYSIIPMNILIYEYS